MLQKKYPWLNNFFVAVNALGNNLTGIPGLLTFAETNFNLMIKQAFRLFLPAIIVFITLTILSWIFRNEISANGIDSNVVMSGNTLIFLVTLVAYIMEINGLASRSNPAFLRMFYGSFLIKMMVLIASAFIYIVSVRKNLNKPALFTCMALYIIYTFIEVRALMKIGNRKKNG